MGTYLVVAHQTGSSEDLVDGVLGMSREKRGSEFVLLVPATAVEDLADEPDVDDRIAIAEAAAVAGSQALLAAGVAVVGTVVGDSAPLTAVGDELRMHPGRYEGIVVSTFPSGLSHWLRADLPSQVERRFHLPVRHIVAQPPEVLVVPIGADVMD